LAAVIVACGGHPGNESARRDGLASASTASQAPQAPTELVGVDDGMRMLGLHRSQAHPRCYDREWGPFADPDSWVEFGAEACIRDKPWHVLVGAGGDPGSVDWAIIVGVTRPSVARVEVTSASGAVHERETRPVAGGDERVFSLRLDEEVRTLQAFASGATAIESLRIAPLLRRQCDWICEGEGEWAVLVDPHEDVVDPSPEVELLAADGRLRNLFDETNFDLLRGEEWRDCAGIARGTTWTFLPDNPPVRGHVEWPTVDGHGAARILSSPDPPDYVTVDIDLARKRVVSILPYYATDDLGPPPSAWRPAPLYSDDCRIR
jgi:hypothetical protein